MSDAKSPKQGVQVGETRQDGKIDTTSTLRRVSIGRLA